MNKFSCIKTYSLFGGRTYWDEGERCYEDYSSIEIISHDGLYGLRFNYNSTDFPLFFSVITHLYHSETEIWFIVKKNNKYGIIYCNIYGGSLCLDIKYDYIDCSHKVKPKIFCKNLQGIYDIEKGLLIPCIYNNIVPAIKIFTSSSNYNKLGNGYIVELNKLRGLCNDSGNLIIPCRFTNIYCMENYYLVEKDNLKGVYRDSGELIPTQYDRIDCIYTDWFIIYSNNLCGLYYKNKELCPPICSQVKEYYTDIILIKGNDLGIVVDKSNFLFVSNCQEIKHVDYNYIAIKEKGKWGLINTKGESIIIPKFQALDSIEPFEFYFRYTNNNTTNHPLFIVKINGFYGVIDANDNYIIPPIYIIIIYSNNYFYGRKDYKVLRFDSTGKFIKEFYFLDSRIEYHDSEDILFKYDSSNINLLFSD